MQKTKILLVEDDETASFLMQNFLEDCDFLVMPVFTVTDAISHLQINHYDLLLLDLNLPDFTGFDLLSKIKTTIAIPIIITSAHSDTTSIVKAFKFGVHDYIVKPVNFLELEARIWGLLGRYDNIKIDKKKKHLFEIQNNQILFNDKYINLTPLEFDILSFFIKNIEQVISRDLLVKSIPSIKSHRLLDNHIKNIRKKIEEDSSKPKYLRTIYATGYILHRQF